MEMEFFVPPAEAEKWHDYWMERAASSGTSSLGVRTATSCGCARTAPRSCRTTSSATSDIEYLFPMGWSELEGIANRGDFDLTQHAEYSGQKLDYVDSATGERYVPNVIEPAAGADRAILALLMVDAYDEDEIGGERDRAAPPPRLAPVKAAVLPLVNKDGQPEKARAIYEELARG